MIHFKEEIAKGLEPHIETMTAGEIEEAIEYPKYAHLGDFAFPCFRLAKVFRKSPQLIAESLAEHFADHELFSSVEAAGGYLNFKIDPGTFARSVLETVNAAGEAYGRSDLGAGQTVIVEFSSTNIAKPFHMGHIRSTMIGNSLYRIHKALGYDTIAINHLGDYGTQFGKLIVAFKLWGDRETIEQNPIPELLKLYVRFHEEAEKNPEMDNEARAWFLKLEQGDQEAYDLWKWIKDVSLMEFNRVYEMLGVHFDSYAGESFYSDKMPAVLTELREKNVLQKSDGAEIVDLEPYGMPPALVTKSDGSTLYITRDIAAAIYRKKHYDFDKNIYVVGSQQRLHFQQWFKIVELMGYDWYKDCIHVDFGMVALEEGSLSTRRGRVVFLEDVLNKAVEKTKEIIEEKNPNLENKDEVAKQVGVGAVVFQELSNNRIKDYTFSWDSTLSFEGDSGPYVQYTYARSQSVLKKAGAYDLQGADYGLLDDEASLEVVRLIAKYPEVIEDASRKYEPSLITRHIADLAKAFNKFYHDNAILVDDAELRKARLALVKATGQTIKNGLYLISLEAPEEM